MSETNWPLVLKEHLRPAGDGLHCFYCKQPVGSPHGFRCSMVCKKVKVRYIFELEIDVPQSWTKDDVEFNRNDGTWCADNAVSELEQFTAVDGERSCLCNRFKCEFVDTVDNTPNVPEGR